MDGPKNRNRQSPSAMVGIGDVIQAERALVAEEEGGHRRRRCGGGVLSVSRIILEPKVRICTLGTLTTVGKDPFSEGLGKEKVSVRKGVKTKVARGSFRNQKTNH